MQAYLEHANVSVNNIDSTIKFIQTAIPEFKIRHQGEGDYRWVHLGTEQSYLALQEVTAKERIERTPYLDAGFNHLGLVVADLHAVIERLSAAGYQQNEIASYHPHRRRAYFFDDEGIEWEFIEYLSQAPEKRNDYQL